MKKTHIWIYFQMGGQRSQRGQLLHKIIQESLRIQLLEDRANKPHKHLHTADFIKKVLWVYTRSMETIYLSPRAQVAVGTFFMKSPVFQKGIITRVHLIIEYVFYSTFHNFLPFTPVYVHIDWYWGYTPLQTFLVVRNCWSSSSSALGNGRELWNGLYVIISISSYHIFTFFTTQ